MELHSPLSPMLASEASEPFDGDGWVFEPKLDGIRIVAEVEADAVTLRTRSGQDVTPRFTGIVGELKALGINAVMDGEVVQLDAQGRASFEGVMSAYHEGSSSSLYYVFDLLRLNGSELVGEPYEVRRAALESLPFSGEHVRLIESFPRDGKMVFQQLVNLGFEGMLAKRTSSTYQPGRRSADWVKVKALTTEDFVVCGWLDGEGHRSDSFGSLLLGTWEAGALKYRGNVGTGFSEALAVQLRRKLDTLATPLPSTVVDRATLRSKPHWVRPELTVEVAYQTLTSAGRLRMPRFIKLREQVEAGV